MAKIERSQKLFLKAMKEKFAGEDPSSLNTAFLRKGLEQSERKREFMKEGKKVEMERGISQYDPKRCHLGGIPLGQRQLMSYEVSGTGTFVGRRPASSTTPRCSRCGTTSAARSSSHGLAHQTLQRLARGHSRRSTSTAF
jgi:hypothetical protein